MTKITLLCFVKVGCIECSSLLCFFVLIVYACFNICSELSSFTELKPLWDWLILCLRIAEFFGHKIRASYYKIAS